MKSHTPAGATEHFSLPLFLLTILATLGVIFLALRFLFPAAWTAQFEASWTKGAAVFALVSLLNAFVEYFFHRYILHTSALPWLSRFHRLHTLHHGLTRVVSRRFGSDEVLVIENRFPMEEPEQHEASFFPWYTLGAFALLLTPLLTLASWCFPSFPWFLSGYLALACSLTLYEVLHALNHWPLEKWQPLLTQSRWSRIWRAVYGFHLRHHAVIDCNESISGFFGLPVADWLFNTCMIPKTVYAQGETWSADKFARPKPVALIRWLDRVAAGLVRQRRLSRSKPSVRADDPVSADTARAYTRGELVANWLTHGIGLLLSVAALTLLVIFSSVRGDAWHVVSFTVFGLTLLILYAASTLYHSWRSARATRWLQRLDHAAIFLLIAGTYTPFLLTSLRGPWGWSLLGVIWGLCGAGAVFQMLFGPRMKLVSLTAYLFLGWLIVIALGPLLAAVPAGGLWLLLAGGLCYTVGAIFYRWHALRYHHAYWHLFVLAGSACHFLSVLLFLTPPAA
jgi:hemolysin III